MRGARVDALWAGLLALLAVAWFSQSWGRIIDPRDEGYLLVQAARVLAGELPHRDFNDVYGPASLPLTALVLRMTGGDILSMHVFMGAVRSAGVAVGFLAMRQLAPLPWALVASMLAIAFWGRFEWNLNTPYAAVFTIVLLQLSLLLALVGRRAASARWLFVAGLAAGSGLLFKQSLALLGGYGLGLALLADGMLAAPAAAPRRGPSRAVGAAWLLGAALLPLPVSSFLSLSDYLIHLAPIHGLMLLLWLSARRRGSGLALGEIIRSRLLPFAAGAALLPLGAAAVYAGWGALDDMLRNMFVLPMSRIGYARPIVLPSLPAGLVAIGLGALLAAAIALLRPALKTAAATLAAGLLSLAGGILLARSRGAPLASLVRGLPEALEGLQLAAIAVAGLVALGWAFRSSSPDERERARAAVPALFFHGFLCFQFFPRAGPDLHIAQGAQMIALAAVLPILARAWLPGAGLRRAACATLLLLPAMALALPLVHEVMTIPPGRPLKIPRAEGIRLAHGAIDQLEIDDMERLIGWLNEQEPADAPLFVLSNEELIHHATGRPTLFPDRRAELFWLGWQMLPSARVRQLDPAAMIERLRAHPEALVIDNRRYLAADRKRRALPQVWAFVSQEYEMIRRFGAYRVHRARAPEARDANPP